MERGSTTTGRLLALDVGSRRIGLAVSDALGITAQGLPTIQRKNKRADFAELERVILHYHVSEIIVGFPLHMRTGSHTAGSERMELFAEELRERYQVPVHLWDERLTTAEAQRVLRASAMSVKRRREVVDQMAAVLILQSFMENRKHL
jgi:putative Holliday junction resolvase